MEGFQFPFEGEQSMVTVFSAPNYCYEYNNKGAIMQVDKDLLCQFCVLEPVNWEKEADLEPVERPGTPPRHGPNAEQRRTVAVV
jgi:serine/threonine-protein phosphatase PP1 catalytic subunit